ncbi:MAG: cob(I)yrinic acid a,c-diamide adenosyltransferase [Balneolaceae bacterium]|nr:cob(I)yrinic acid a,c-diamide adenosyltransferase [Balneolaceae bacterium]MBO6546724.1 cob(I)yrinic acid a,c-diamide adenosyltransferase [Balneolaceae bacterium]MBO6649082.1 cob(I)yrinic acid a,c-diamide adenosyltransferase [Balneolaceae bacterium]
MKIYTKKGDKGSTSLYGGQTVSKSSKRIAAYGTVDELNSVLGMILTEDHSNKTNNLLSVVQEHLFVLGADLATPLSKETRINRISEEDISFLENSIDEMENELPPLRSFILPGGTKAGAIIHFSRTVCRRAERLAVECAAEEDISPESIKYLNRLSDFLFVSGRYENHISGTAETPWIPKK